MPQYGEYATPEQQAAAMGKHYVAPIPPPVPETRVNLAAPAATEERLHIHGHPGDRFATILQLSIGFVALVTVDFFHIAESMNAAFARLGVSHRVSTTVDALGWVLLGANVLFLVATALWAYSRVRRGLLAFWVPAVGYVAFNLVFVFIVYR